MGIKLWPKLFDLFAVFFERKLTLGIGVSVGDQLWWCGCLSFEQAPIFWLGFAVIWATAWVLMGYILRLLRLPKSQAIIRLWVRTKLQQPQSAFAHLTK